MSSITRKVFTALAASAVTASVAAAQVNIQYNTTGTFSGVAPDCVVAANTVTCGTSSLLFTGLLGQVATANPGGTNISYGNIDLSSTTVAPATDAFSGLSFRIGLSQTIPPAGVGAFIGSLTGTVNATSSGLFINFTTSSFDIAGVNYIVQNPTLVVAPTTNGGVTTVQGIATATSVVPEPATVILMGSGLAALGFFGARRKKD